MPDLTPFEARLTDLLVADSLAGIRPVDRYAIARSVIGGGMAGGRLGRLGRATGRPMLIAATVALLVLALAAGALLVAGRLHLEVLPVRHSYTGELISAPDLPTPMERPVVVALLDGRVLIIGADNADPTSVAYPYDPATGISVPVPVVHGAIDAAVRLDDGRVLAIGDEGAQLFDPASGRFSAVGPMLADRTGASMTVLRDSRVLIAGGMPARGESGVDSALRSAELFDPATMAFSPTGSIATPTGGGPMVTLSDGRVFMATDPTAKVYDPATGTFSAATTMSGGGGRPVVLSDGRVVLFGSTGLYSGGSITVWDPTTGRFTTGSVPEPLTGATLLDDGRILVIGMCRGRQTGWTGLYDPATGDTNPGPPTQACRPTPTRLADGRVLIVGGDMNEDFSGVRTVQIFR